ncbi:hypothetical protein EDF61_10658 [Arthrobacter sp. JUb115]|nr:hypothetical protein EDF61_10658 [Arthrobacter sp. JUb115]
MNRDRTTTSHSRYRLPLEPRADGMDLAGSRVSHWHAASGPAHAGPPRSLLFRTGTDGPCGRIRWLANNLAGRDPPTAATLPHSTLEYTHLVAAFGSSRFSNIMNRPAPAPATCAIPPQDRSYLIDANERRAHAPCCASQKTDKVRRSVHAVNQGTAITDPQRNYIANLAKRSA